MYQVDFKRSFYLLSWGLVEGSLYRAVFGNETLCEGESR